MIVGEGGQTGLWCNLTEQSQHSLCLSFQQVSFLMEILIWEADSPVGMNTNILIYISGQIGQFSGFLKI